MPNKLLNALLTATLAGFLGLGSHSLAAAEYSFMEQLKQCETALKASRNPSLSQADGAKEREKHFRLVIDILKNLNEQSIAAANEGRALTPEELSIQTRVMGHMIHMLAINQLAPEKDAVAPKSGDTAPADPWEDWYY